MTKNELIKKEYDIYVYKADGKLRCIYLNNYRIAGSKPLFFKDSLYGEYKVSLQCIMEAIPALQTMNEQLTQAQQKLAVAIEALEYYANQDNYHDGVIGSIQKYGWGEDWGNDNGAKAQAALTTIKGKL